MSQRYEITEGLTRRDGHKELTSTAGQVVVVTPFMRHHCCFGCLTLYQGNLLVAVFEIVQLALFIPPSINFVLNDGHIFYTNELAGKGREIGICSVVFMTVALFVITLMVIGTWKRQYLLIIPHIIWQMTTIVIMSWLIYTVYDRMREETVPESHRILRPAGIVIIIFFTVPTLLEIWWVTVVTDACWHIRRQQLTRLGLLTGSSDTASFAMANDERTPSPSVTSSIAFPSPLLSSSRIRANHN
uniref:Uncharacterized protein n=1 Tax=Plectus sambesii TaxID=2011161 RepID=A0A914WH87_9BILA